MRENAITYMRVLSCPQHRFRGVVDIYKDVVWLDVQIDDVVPTSLQAPARMAIPADKRNFHEHFEAIPVSQFVRKYLPRRYSVLMHTK